MLLNTVVLWIHIIGAVGWLGSTMVFGMVIGPSLPRLSPQARSEFFATVAPRFASFAETFSIVTPVFGVIMVAVIANGDYSVMSTSTTFGLCITVGAVLALVAMALGLAVVAPAARKVARLSEAWLKSPGPPTPELLATAKRLRVSSSVDLGVLFLVTIFMVAAATL